jgi:hypothetical protein
MCETAYLIALAADREIRASDPRQFKNPLDDAAEIWPNDGMQPSEFRSFPLISISISVFRSRARCAR